MSEPFLPGDSGEPSRGSELRDLFQQPRTRLMVAALALAVVGGGGYVLLGGGSSSEEVVIDVASPPSSSQRAAGTETESGSETKTATKTGTKAGTRPGTASAKTGSATASVLPAASQLRAGRNPFKALVVAPAAGSGATASGGGSGGSPAAPGAPAAPLLPIAPLAPVVPEEPEPTSYALTLKKVVGTNGLAQSTFSFAGKDQTVLRGQRFGTYGELVVLSFDKNVGVPTLDVVLQVGDGAPFAMRVGQTRQVL